MPVFLICEFDPLHYGHRYIMDEAKRVFPGEALVCVMSGNFVQRGNPAVCDKFARAKAAVRCGADLVLSLPFPWSSGSAEYFAKGAVSVIDGICEGNGALIFGSECADAKRLTETAAILSSDSFKRALSERIARHSEPYAKARQKLFEELYGGADILSNRNDILATEYIKAISGAGSRLEIYPVKRKDPFLSSSVIRNSKDPSALVPDEMKNAFANTASYENFARAIIYHLRTLEDKTTAEGAAGVLDRICSAAKKAKSVKELFGSSAASAYTDAKLRRAVLYSLTGVYDRDLKSVPAYTQLLAANGTGLEFLKKTKKTKSISVITKPADADKLDKNAAISFKLENRADDLYCMLTEKTLPQGEFLRKTPYIEKE